MNQCRHCGEPFEQNRQGTRLFCSARCRVAWHRKRTDEKNRTVRVEDPTRPAFLRERHVAILDALALDLENDLVDLEVESELADLGLVDEGLTTGRASWRYEDPTLEAFTILQSDPWFDFE